MRVQTSRFVAALWLGFLGCAVAQVSVDPKLDTNGVPYAWIDAAPKIGTIKGVNRDFGFLIATLDPEILNLGTVKLAKKVASRRDGVVMAHGLVEEVNGKTIVIFLKEQLDPRVGDDLIFYPPKPPSLSLPQ